MTTAKEIKKTLKGDKLNFESIESIMNELGYSIKFFNTPTGDIEI